MRHMNIEHVSTVLPSLRYCYFSVFLFCCDCENMSIFIFIEFKSVGCDRSAQPNDLHTLLLLLLLCSRLSDLIRWTPDELFPSQQKTRYPHVYSVSLTKKGFHALVALRIFLGFGGILFKLFSKNGRSRIISTIFQFNVLSIFLYNTILFRTFPMLPNDS